MKTKTILVILVTAILYLSCSPTFKYSMIPVNSEVCEITFQEKAFTYFGDGSEIEPQLQSMAEERGFQTFYILYKKPGYSYGGRTLTCSVLFIKNAEEQNSKINFYKNKLEYMDKNSRIIEAAKILEKEKNSIDELKMIYNVFTDHKYLTEYSITEHTITEYELQKQIPDIIESVKSKILAFTNQCGGTELFEILKDIDKSPEIFKDCRNDSVNFILKNSLNNKIPNIRERAIRSLGLLKDTSVVPMLIECLQDSSINIQMESVTALGEIQHKSATQPLIKMLNLNSYDDDLGRKSVLLINEELILALLIALQSICDTSATISLIPYLNSPNYKIALKTIRTLGELKDKRAIEPLTQYIFNKDSEIRLITLQTLRKMNAGISPLEVIHAYTQTGDERLIQYIYDVCPPDNVDEVLFNKLPDLLPDWQLYELRSLGKLPKIPLTSYRDLDESRIIYLEIYNGDHSQIMRKFDQVNELLFKDLDSDNTKKIDFAVNALIVIGSQNTVKHLIEFLEDYDKAWVAKIYLNSHNDDLEKAARKWCADNHYIITESLTGSYVNWGYMR